MPSRTRPRSKSGGAPQNKVKPWFRVDNAFTDDNASNDEKTIVYIYDQIGGGGWFSSGTAADDFVMMLSGIKSKVIELHINSPGGDVFDGIAIYNALKAHSARVEVVVDALAASAASFIAQAGDKITMTAAATMMIHDGSAGTYGPAAFHRETADLLDKLSNTVAGIYSRSAGESKEFWRNLMIQEVWYDAEEAVEAGLAHEVGDDTKKEDEEVSNGWDLSIYNHAGRTEAPDPMEFRRKIANEMKEAPVGTEDTQNPPQNPPVEETEEEKVAREAAEAAAAAPPTETPTPETAPVEPAAPAQPAPAVPAPDNFVPKNVAGSPVVFRVNGAETSDPVAIQNALNRTATLETFRTENVKAGKVQFVQDLARDNKIPATMIDRLTAYAQSLSDDAAYEAWKSTYDEAPSIPMLTPQPGGTSSPSAPQTHAGESASSEIENCKEIIQQHKLGGMKDEVIKTTASYVKLITLDPTYKL